MGELEIIQAADCQNRELQIQAWLDVRRKKTAVFQRMLINLQMGVQYLFSIVPTFALTCNIVRLGCLRVTVKPFSLKKVAIVS